MKKQTGTNKHQNLFAFKHNKGSKKTRKIQLTPNKGVCEKCHEMIEWRKKFRKYKPLTAPRKCNLCERKNITLAYHVVCDECAHSKRICAKCQTPDSNRIANELQKKAHNERLAELDKSMSTMTLKQQHTLMRKINKEEFEAREKKRQERAQREENGSVVSQSTTAKVAQQDDLDSQEDSDSDEDDENEDQAGHDDEDEDDLDDDDDDDEDDDEDEEEEEEKQVRVSYPKQSNKKPTSTQFAVLKSTTQPTKEEDSDSSDFDED
ncbi:hypothetical protein AKO1_010334, partial [Acrasis kona]